jgi:serine phosphatase RsbU (regulator of sigma subunit)/HAMP domain-containing protein
MTSPVALPRPPNWWRRRSLRVRIVAWFFVPAALLFLAVAATNFFAYQDVTADLVTERNQDLTRRSASQLSSSLGEFTEALEEVGRTMDVSQPAGPSRFPALQRSGALSMFDGGVVVLDTFGTPVASYPEDTDGSFEDWTSLQVSREQLNAFLLGLVRSDRPVFSNVLGSRAQDQLAVAVGVPILGSRGELLGATVGMFDVGPTSVSALYARIVRLRLSQGGSVYLVDDRGQAVYHSNFRLTGSDLSGEDAVQQVLTSGVGALRTTSGTGEDVVAAYAPVPGTPWGLISEAPWSALTSASRGYQQFLLALLALGILVPIVIVGIGIHRLMRPVDELIAATRAVGAGDLSTKVESPSGDEIGVLAISFNQMTGQVADRTRELKVLEGLGRAIVNGPSDASNLPEMLADYIPAMFPDEPVEVRIFPDQALYHSQDGPPQAAASVWEWLAGHPTPEHFPPGQVPPWDTTEASHAVALAPILDVETKEPIGGIHLSIRRDPDRAASVLPAVQSLAAQIASALHGAKVYEQELAHESVNREMTLAGEIQANFLPDTLPDVPGWQLAAILKPARKTSGDFYDAFPLPDGRLGILIADVVGKGMGAALFMALSRTLIRTFAVEQEAQPAAVLAAANHRILADTHAGLFVTVFYGVLDPSSGELTYANAGHNPPYLLDARNGDTIEELERTGVPVGILEGTTWQQQTVSLAPGAVLMLYTDGITEAQDAQEDFFDEERLQEVARANLGRSAAEIQDAVIARVGAFVGDAPQSDDMALMVAVRSPAGSG